MRRGLRVLPSMRSDNLSDGLAHLTRLCSIDTKTGATNTVCAKVCCLVAVWSAHRRALPHGCSSCPVTNDLHVLAQVLRPDVMGERMKLQVLAQTPRPDVVGKRMHLQVLAQLPRPGVMGKRMKLQVLSSVAHAAGKQKACVQACRR